MVSVDAVRLCTPFLLVPLESSVVSYVIAPVVVVDFFFVKLVRCLKAGE